MRLKKKAERCRMKDKKAQRVDNIHINDRPMWIFQTMPLCFWCVSLTYEGFILPL